MDIRAGDLAAALQARYDLAPAVTIFALEHAGVNNVNIGVRTGNGVFVARTYDSLSYAEPASIQYEHELLGWLARQDLSFAVPVPVPTRDGMWCYRGENGWWSLAPKLPGTPLARQPYDAGRFGAALGELQLALRRYSCTPRPPRALFDDLFTFGSPALEALKLRPTDPGLPPSTASEDLFGWWQEEAARLAAFVDGAYRALPWQLCHNDVTPNNVLAEDGVVTGLLDFEFAVPTARAMDFATSLRMVLRFWEPEVAWGEIQAFCQGYARWISLTDAELDALPDLLRLRSAITVLWWIGRAAGTGVAGPIPERIASAQKVARWLASHQSRLTDLVAQARR